LTNCRVRRERFGLVEARAAGIGACEFLVDSKVL
jgi:hypothetical protein